MPLHVSNEQIPRDQEKLDYLEKKEQRLLSKFIKATDLRTSADYKLEEGVLYFRYGQYDSTQSLPGNWVWDEWKRAGKHSLMADILEMIKQEEEFSIKGIM